MQVETILKSKGRRVATTTLRESIAVIVARLRADGIGSLVVTDENGRILGLIGEREIVDGLMVHGADLLGKRVEEVMTRSVPTCQPSESLQDVMAKMTLRRVRHLPVIDDSGTLCGIVSIGDVVKNRLEELELETNVLRDAYLARA
jgi:CBS domain-containing protein